MDIQAIQKQIDALQERRAFLRKVIRALSKGPHDTIDSIFQEYVRTESVAKVAQMLREKGARTERDKSFQPSDVSEIIKRGHPNVDSSLVALAQEIFNKNTKAVAARYW